MLKKLNDYMQVRRMFVFVVYEKFKIGFYLELLFKRRLLKHFISSSDEVVAVVKLKQKRFIVLFRWRRSRVLRM